MRPGMGPSSFYDPISAGSSRRSSQLSTATTGGVSIPPPPPSHLLAGQLQRLQSSPKPSSNLILQTQNVSLQQAAIQQSLLNTNLADSIRQSNTTNNSSDTRRMSEPCHTLTDRKSPPPRPASVTLSPLKGAVSSTELHPNQAVVLDEVGEGEMVENKLVIPDEMVHYLNQVADTQNDFTGLQWTEGSNRTENPQKPVPSPAANVNQILPSPPSNFNQTLPSPQTNVLSPMSTVNQVLHSPGSLTQMLPSPASTMNQMVPSPASNFNQMMPSPASNFNTIPNPLMSPAATMNQIASPVSNMNQMVSPASNLNQMVPSPANTVNQMVGSPASNLNQMVPSPMSVRCHSQNMQNSQNMNQLTQNQMLHSPSHSNMMQQSNHMIPNGHVMPNGMNMPNQCYNNQMQQNMCYSNWNNQMVQNAMCENQNQIPQNDHHNMCQSRNGNLDYNNHCKPVMQANGGYNGMNMQNRATSQCGNHNYQMCNTNGYINGCPSKNINGYTCNSTAYPPMQSPSYSCVPNMVEPLSSPAMATPAPSDIANQPQQAQMSRPCTHYDQNCYRTPYNNQPTMNVNNQCVNCNCRKMNMYPPHNKCIHQCNKPEIQCKDISQSQMSPGIINTTNTNPQTPNGTVTLQPLGMRQDAYQRTLEYVQNCQSWVSNDIVTSSTHPLAKCGETTSSNMVVNDMTSSLSSLLEENRYLQLIQ